MRRKTFVVLPAMHFECEQAEAFKKIARSGAGLLMDSGHKRMASFAS
ncbi:MAG TPA: hypothetical protein VK603_12030 [Candidatus Saccharimonadales bacterium]|nr:hypothetical protein [Candidatus Saccharimonadales bacterium]